MRNLLLATGASLALLVSTAIADEPPHKGVGFEAKTLMKANQTADGGPLKYPQAKPEITYLAATIQPGGRSALHHHPVVTVVYVLEGEFEVRSGETVRHYKAGEVLIEPIDSPMQAFNLGSVPTKLLIVHVGEEGKPNGVAAQ